MSARFLRVEAPHFTAHAEIVDRRVSAAPHDCAPIIAYMRGWDGAKVAAYCRRMGWTLTVHRYPTGARA